MNYLVIVRADNTSTPRVSGANYRQRKFSSRATEKAFDENYGAP